MLEYIIELNRLILFNVLFFAAIAKIKDRVQFIENLSYSFQISHTQSSTLHGLIILVELTLGIALLFKTFFLHYSLILTTLLLIAFTLVIGYFLLTNKPFKCNCFGESTHNVNISDVFRNLIIILISISGVVFPSHQFYPSPLEYLVLYFLSLNIFILLANTNLIFRVTHTMVVSK